MPQSRLDDPSEEKALDAQQPASVGAITSCWAELCFRWTLVAAAIGVIWWVTVGASAHDARVFDAQQAKVAQLWPETLKKLDVTTPAATEGSFQPQLRWVGADSALIHASAPDIVKPTFLPTYASWEVLARTASGRYFVVRYRLNLGDECDSPVDCLLFDCLTPMTEEMLKEWLFMRELGVVYKQIFNEPMPPKVVKA